MSIKSSKLIPLSNGRAVRFYSDGRQEWHLENGDMYVMLADSRLHNPYGPACELASGTEMWMYEGLPHREDGPAIISRSKEVEMYYGGPMYQSPASESSTNGHGCQEWFLHGQRHRLDGPAVIFADGSEEYWEYGKLVHFQPGEYSIGEFQNLEELLNKERTPEDLKKIRDKDYVDSIFKKLYSGKAEDAEEVQKIVEEQNKQ